MANSDSPQQPVSLTLDQALQQAIAHHRAGRLQDAERLYRAILQAQPSHPDANHNLGVLAVQLKQPAAGLPHFKAALGTNSNQGQYWLSYIDALIQTGQTDAARQALEQGKRRGLQGKMVEALAERLEGLVGNKPSQQELEMLVALFNKGRYTEASTLSQSMTVRFPLHGFGWKALGVALKKMGQTADALGPMQKAVALSLGDAEAHNNLGDVLRDLRQLDDAVASCRRALEIKPDYVEAHNNLGNALQDLGQLDGAAASYRRALEIKPDHVEAHNNLGVTLQDLGQLDEAAASYRRALEIKPDYAEAHSNLGVTLHDLGQLNDAAASHRRALEVKPDYAEAHYNLGHTLWNLDDLDQAAAAYQKTWDIDPINIGLDAAVYSAVLYYLDGNFEQCRRKHHASRLIMAKADPKHKNVRPYWLYLDKLLSLSLKPYQKKNQAQEIGVLHVVGESHALSAHGVIVRYKERELRCVSEWIYGCKQWHLGNNKPNKYKYKFEAVMARLPPRSTILLTIGEIDCRHDEGILKAWKKHQNKTLAEIVQSTAEAYINYVAAIGERYGHRIIMGGVPAPNISFDTLTAAEAAQFVNLITVFNSTLMEFSLAAGMDFLDVYSLTDRGDGIASGQWHIDNYHLLPCAVTEAFAKHCIQSPMAANFMRTNSILPPPKGGSF